jgi:hypothetical protein
VVDTAIVGPDIVVVEEQAFLHYMRRGQVSL